MFNLYCFLNPTVNIIVFFILLLYFFYPILFSCLMYPQIECIIKCSKSLKILQIKGHNGNLEWFPGKELLHIGSQATVGNCILKSDFICRQSTAKVSWTMSLAKRVLSICLSLQAVLCTTPNENNPLKVSQISQFFTAYNVN